MCFKFLSRIEYYFFLDHTWPKVVLLLFNFFKKKRGHKNIIFVVEPVSGRVFWISVFCFKCFFLKNKKYPLPLVFLFIYYLFTSLFRFLVYLNCNRSPHIDFSFSIQKKKYTYIYVYKEIKKKFSRKRNKQKDKIKKNIFSLEVWQRCLAMG